MSEIRTRKVETKAGDMGSHTKQQSRCLLFLSSVLELSTEPVCATQAPTTEPEPEPQPQPQQDWRQWLTKYI